MDNHNVWSGYREEKSSVVMKDESAYDPALLALLNSIVRWRSQRCDLLLQSGRLADAHALAQEFMGWGDDQGKKPPLTGLDQGS